MIGALGGLAAMQVLLAALGAAALALLGLAPDLRGLPRAALALLVGTCTWIAVVTPLVYVGARPTPLVLCLLTAVAIALAAARGARPRLPARPQLGMRWWSALAIALPLGLVGASAAGRPAVDFDAFSGWLLKARMLAAAHGQLAGSLDARVFASRDYGFTANEYPLGKPALDALALHFTGTGDARAVHLVPVILLAAFAGSAYGLLAPRAGAGLTTAVLVALLWMPRVQAQAITAYADVPVACLAAVTALALWRYVVDDDVAFLRLAALAGTACALVKEEGVADVAALFAVAVAALLLRREPRRVRAVGVAGVVVAALLAPWTVYVKLHGIHESDVQLDARRTFDRLDTLPTIVRELAGLLAGRGYLGVPVLALLVVLAALAVRGSARAIGVAVLGTAALLLAALVLVYLNATISLASMLHSSAPRTLLGVVFLAAVALPVLVERLERRS